MMKLFQQKRINYLFLEKQITDGLD